MKRLLLGVVALAVVLLAGLLVINFVPGVLAPPPPQFNGTVLQTPVAAPDFTLTTAGDRQVSLSDFEGKVVAIYFGYTFCPDVCPETMFELGQVQRQVDDEADEMQVIMISVDPERDTPQVMGEYMAHFHPSFVGLTGTMAEIDEVAQDYGVYYQHHEGTAASGYLVDHTARVYVIDRKGNIRLSFPFGMERADMISDLRVLTNED